MPTTPEGSQSFSPVIHDAGSDGLEDSSGTSAASENDSEVDSLVGTRPVRHICCVGAGYVGGPTAAVIAFQNSDIVVTVVDRDERRIRRWNSRHLPIYEPNLAEIVRIARDGLPDVAFPIKSAVSDQLKSVLGTSVASSKGENQSQDGHRKTPATLTSRQPNLFFSTEVSECIGKADIIIIAVNTPTKLRGAGAGSATDMTAFEAVTAEVAQHATPGAIVVEKSTVPCRTAEMLKETMAVRRPGVHFEILSNPEFLAAGTAVQDLLHPDRVLIGSASTAAGQRAAESLVEVYASWVDRSRIITTNVWSSELAKLVANSMLAQRLSSINSMSAICEATGAEIREVSASIGSDPRIGDKFLRAGIGFGGSCFKKDVLSLVYLAESLGLREVGAYWRQVVIMNDYQRNRFTSRVIKCLNNTLVGKKVTILGYAFKKNTSDTREAPALEIIKILLDESPREIAIFDPCCNPIVIKGEIRQLHGYGRPMLSDDGGPVKVCSNAYEACAASNAVLIVTEFDEFRNTKQTASHTSPSTLKSEPVSSSPALAAAIELPQRFNPERTCADDCPDCRSEKNGGTPAGTMETYQPKEQVDWEKIAYHMRKPKWLFDGRCIIDAKEMAKLGVRVESIGSSGRA